MNTLASNDGVFGPTLCAQQHLLTTDSSGPTLGPVYCQVPGCPVELIKSYCIKKRTCNAHLQAAAVQLSVNDPTLWRFCQQCGRFEPLSKFDDSKRSCRARLAKRRSGSRSVFTKKSCLPRTHSNSVEHHAAAIQSAAATAVQSSWDSVLPESNCQGESSSRTDSVMHPPSAYTLGTAAAAASFHCAVAGHESSPQREELQDWGAQPHPDCTPDLLLSATSAIAAAAEGPVPLPMHDTDYTLPPILPLRRADTCSSTAANAAAGDPNDAVLAFLGPLHPELWGTSDEIASEADRSATKYGHPLSYMEHKGYGIAPLQQRRPLMPQQQRDHSQQLTRLSSGNLSDNSCSLDGLLPPLPLVKNGSSNISSGNSSRAAEAAVAAAVGAVDGANDPAQCVVHFNTKSGGNSRSPAALSDSGVHDPVSDASNPSTLIAYPASAAMAYPATGMTHPSIVGPSQLLVTAQTHYQGVEVTGCSPALAGLSISCPAAHISATGSAMRSPAVVVSNMSSVTVDLPKQDRSNMSSPKGLTPHEACLGHQQHDRKHEAAVAAWSRQQQQQQVGNSRLQWLVQQVQTELQRCSSTDIEQMTEAEVDMLLLAALSAQSQGDTATAADGVGIDNDLCEQGSFADWQQQQQWAAAMPTQYVSAGSGDAAYPLQLQQLKSGTDTEAARQVCSNPYQYYSNLELSAPTLLSNVSLGSVEVAAAAAAAAGDWQVQQQQGFPCRLALSEPLHRYLPDMSGFRDVAPARRSI